MNKVKNGLKQLALDVNEAEITSHVEDGTLGQWINSWRTSFLREVDKLPDQPTEVAKEQNRVKVRTEADGHRSCVYNGRLYVETAKDRFHAMPLGMDDARDMKQRPLPDIMVKDGIVEKIKEREIPDISGIEGTQATDDFAQGLDI